MTVSLGCDSVEVMGHPCPVTVIENAPNIILGGGGTPGSGEAYVLNQFTPSAQWSFTNPTGRLCGVEVYVAGEIVGADVYVTASLITVTFPSPTSGAVVIT